MNDKISNNYEKSEKNYKEEYSLLREKNLYQESINNSMNDNNISIKKIKESDSKTITTQKNCADLENYENFQNISKTSEKKNPIKISLKNTDTISYSSTKKKIEKNKLDKRNYCKLLIKKLNAKSGKNKIPKFNSKNEMVAYMKIIKEQQKENS